MANPAIKLKVGDTLECTATYKDSNGNSVNLTTAGITVSSRLLSPDGETSADLAVAPLDQSTLPGQFTIRGETAHLVAGKGWRWDIRYTDSTGFSFSSETEIIDLSERVA